MLTCSDVWLAAVEVETNVAVPVSSDKGLCGGINSTVSRYARGTLKAFNEGMCMTHAASVSACTYGSALRVLDVSCFADMLDIAISVPFHLRRVIESCLCICRAEGQKSELVVIGEKARAQLARDQAPNIKETIADVAKVRITYPQVGRQILS